MRSTINQEEINLKLESLNELLTDEDKIKIQNETMEFFEKRKKIMAKEGITEDQAAMEKKQAETIFFENIKTILVDSRQKDEIESKFRSFGDAVASIVFPTIMVLELVLVVAGLVAIGILNPFLLIPAIPAAVLGLAMIYSVEVSSLAGLQLQDKSKSEADLDKKIVDGELAYTELYSFFNSEKISVNKEDAPQSIDDYEQGQVMVH